MANVIVRNLTLLSLVTSLVLGQDCIAVIVIVMLSGGQALEN